MGNMRKIQFVWPKIFATFFFVWGKPNPAVGFFPSKGAPTLKRCTRGHAQADLHFAQNNYRPLFCNSEHTRG